MKKYFLTMNEQVQKLIMITIYIFGVYSLFHGDMHTVHTSYINYLGALVAFSFLIIFMLMVGSRGDAYMVLVIIAATFIFYSIPNTKNHTVVMEELKSVITFLSYLIFIIFFIVMKFEWRPKFIFGESPEAKLKLGHAKIRDIVEKNKDELDKIELYTIDKLDREYKALGMIDSTESSKEDAKLALQLQAFRLEADAIVNIVSSTTSTTNGNIKADTILSPGGGGNISTSVMYHYEGTAIKYKGI